MRQKNNFLGYAKILSEQYSTFLNNEAIKQNILRTFDGQFPSEYLNSDLTPREFVNQFLLQYYPNEIAIKSKFINQVLLKTSNHVSIFELNVGKSRLDLCKIDGNSTAYEIKTDFDTPKRLRQQMNDYFKVFEKVYLICSVDNLKRMINFIPEECGIYTYYITKTGKYIFKKLRTAVKSTFISPTAQLSVLTKKDLISFFDCPNLETKDEMIDLINSSSKSNKINQTFKLCLRDKFHKKWSFLVDNQSELLEIDYQWFFKNSISPQIVYL